MVSAVASRQLKEKYLAELDQVVEYLVQKGVQR